MLPWEVGGGGGLRVLDLSRNDLSLRSPGAPGRAAAEDAVALLCDALSTGGCCGVTELSLAGNYLKGEGAAAVGAMLRANGVLTALDLSDNRLGNGDEATLLELASGVGEQPRRALRRLDLRANAICFNDASRVLARRLLGHSKLAMINGQRVTAEQTAAAQSGADMDPEVRGRIFDVLWRE